MVAEHIDIWLDDGNVSEELQELSEEDVQQFQQKQKKAKKVRKQMKAQQVRGQKQAHLLVLLLRYVTDLKVLWMFLEIVEQDVSIETVFWMVYPFLMTKKDMIDEELSYSFEKELRLGTYIDYVEELIEMDENLWVFVTEHRDQIEDFVYALIVYFNVDDIKTLITSRGDEHVKELIRSGLRGEE